MSPFQVWQTCSCTFSSVLQICSKTSQQQLLSGVLHTNCCPVFDIMMHSTPAGGSNINIFWKQGGDTLEVPWLLDVERCFESCTPLQDEHQNQQQHTRQVQGPWRQDLSPGPAGLSSSFLTHNQSQGKSSTCCFIGRHAGIIGPNARMLDELHLACLP